MIFDIHDPESTVLALQPKRFSWRWWKRGAKTVGRFVAVALMLPTLHDYVTKALRVAHLVIAACLGFLFVLVEGAAVLYELLACAFLWMIDRETWTLIQKTPLLMQSLILGVVCYVTVIMYTASRGACVYGLVYLSWSTLRLLYFCGMSKQAKPPEKRRKSGTDDAVRSVKSFEELDEEEAEFNSLWR
jgi:hypothetical protein